MAGHAPTARGRRGGRLCALLESARLGLPDFTPPRTTSPVGPCKDTETGPNLLAAPSVCGDMNRLLDDRSPWDGGRGLGGTGSRHRVDGPSHPRPRSSAWPPVGTPRPSSCWWRPGPIQRSGSQGRSSETTQTRAMPRRTPSFPLGASFRDCATPRPSTPGSAGSSSTPAGRSSAVAGVCTRSASTARPIDVDPGPTVSDRVSDTNLLARAFERLDSDKRSLLVLRYLDHDPVTRIAATLGVPVGTAKWRLSEARAALARALAAEGEARR